MKVEIVKDESGLEMIKEDWLKLESGFNSSFYQTFPYNSLWWKYNKDEYRELFILVAYHNNISVAIAPLYLEKRIKGPLSWTELKFIGMGDYRDIIFDSSLINYKTVFNRIMDFVYENDYRWDRILLSYIQKNSNLNYYFFEDDRFRPYYRHLNENPLLRFEKDNDFDIIESRMPSKTRKFRNKLKREVGYKFDVIRKINEDLFEEISNLHIRQQKKMREDLGRVERRSHYEEKSKYDFFKALALLDGKSVLFTLRNTEGELIFYRHCYLHNRVLYSWNTAYDFDYRDYRLNNTAFYEIFKYLSEQDEIDIFDFGTGSYPWKFRWANDYNTIYELDIWNKDTPKLVKSLFKIKDIIG
ncbi:MAG: GNAT family N-acetyltransferase [Tissierellia bacterium]|nr:GNAT family N-acetyltransferase [Tissierellia bacterium]